MVKSTTNRTLRSLREKLKEASSIEEKLEFLDSLESVRGFLAGAPALEAFMADLSQEEALTVKAVIAIGEGKTVFGEMEKADNPEERFAALVKQLVEIERFYDVIGGIAGYQTAVLELLSPKGTAKEVFYENPPQIDISKPSSKVREAVRAAIEAMGQFAEVYPIGGAGDRLDLRDEESGEPLPAAVLPFLGRTLLEGLVRDLQAREYLAFKLTGRQTTVPAALMTSHEKKNEFRIASLCEEYGWFGRGRKAFFLFSQPSVPVVTAEGRWTMRGPLKLNLKPGGHGALWKLMQDTGAFAWMEEEGKTKILVRQINNPISGTDYGLLAFLGFGILLNKKFGFSSCPRLVNAAEGVNVLMESEEGACITNIEYTEFQKSGIEDVPAKKGSPYSAFPANTNILFADIAAVREAAARCPIPGMIMNMKSSAVVGGVEIPAGRLESTMQNIADAITAPDKEHLKTYVTDNERRKIISVAKNSYSSGKPLHGTPEGAFFDLLKNGHDLLMHFCRMKVPALCSEKEYLEKGAPFIFLYHPALGPLYEVIGQKVRGGSLKEGSQLVLELAEADIEELHLDGVLRIEALDPLGKRDGKGIVRYGAGKGCCRLKNVTVRNTGIDPGAQQSPWKDRMHYKESLVVILHGNSEFIAEDIVIEGDHLVQVPDGFRVRAKKLGGELVFEKAPLKKSWEWRCRFDDENKIVLENRV